MDSLRIAIVLALTLFVAEGFVLSIYPEQFKQMLEDLDPRTLQLVGLVETVIALGVMGAVWLV